MPPVYLLLPITNAVKNSWSDIRTKLTLILRRTSRKAAEEGLISERAMQEYFISGRFLKDRDDVLLKCSFTCFFYSLFQNLFHNYMHMYTIYLHGLVFPPNEFSAKLM